MVIAAIFLQDLHDTKLELERMKELNAKALLIQKVLRGYKYRYKINGFKTVLCRFVRVVASSYVVCTFYRKAFLKKKTAALVIQKNWRGHKGRKLYKVVSHVLKHLLFIYLLGGLA